MKQKYVEETWEKLESALYGGNRRSQSHRISKRSINTSRVPSARNISAAVKISQSLITEAQLKKIYKAKCEDMDIPVLPDQESRFVSFCINNFKGRHFYMKESGLSIKSAVAIGKVLKTSSFAFVDLCKNSLSDIGAFALLKEICDSQTLVHLDLSNNDITPVGLENITKILAYHPSITSFDMSSYEGLHRNRIGPQGACFMGNVIRENKILQFLSLAGTGLGDGIEELARGLENNSSLLCLDLSNNGLVGRHMYVLAKSIIKSELKKLDLSQNKIADDGCEFLANMMLGAYEAACPLTHFNLSTNGISSKGAGKLFHALRLNCFILDFNVSGNNFSQGISNYFPSFLADNCALITLDMSSCNIKPEAFANAAEGLSKNEKLENWILCGNKIEDAGVIYLAAGLAKNGRLKSIDFSSCQIKGLGAVTLAKALKGNCTIECLNLKDNSVKDEAGELFVDLTRTNKNYLLINLDLNPVNLKYVEAIKENLKVNKKNWKRQIIPKIIGEIEKIKAPIEHYETVNERIKKRLKERIEHEKKYDLDESIEEIKEKEEKKTKIMQEQSRNLREKNLELSLALEGNQSDMIVRII